MSSRKQSKKQGRDTKRVTRPAPRQKPTTPQTSAASQVPKYAGASKRSATRSLTGTPTNANNVGLAKPARAPYDVLTTALTAKEKAIAEYLHGLATPGYPTKVPIIFGAFELVTNTYQYVFEGVANAGAAGIAYVAAVPDAWQDGGDVEPGPAVGQMLTYAGGVGGYPVWASGFNATSTPAFGGASGANDAKFILPVLDPGFDAQTRYRMTALILEVWSDAPAQTAQGDITIATVSQTDSLQDYSLNSATFNSIVAQPQEFVRHTEAPLAGWRSGEVLSACMVPFDEQCVSMHLAPALGSPTAAAFGVVAVGTGMAPGQTFRYRVTYKYETTVPRTYQTNVTIEPTLPVSTDMIVPYYNGMKNNSVSSGPRGHEVLKGPKALLDGARLSGNGRVANAVVDAARAAKETGVTDIIGSGLRKGASWLLNKVPLVGSFLSTAFDALTG